MIYCGIDWAEKTHDVALVDDTGKLVAKRHITDDAAGYRLLLNLLADHGDSEENPIPIAIETSRGLLVAVLRTGTRQVYAINPMAAARYRDRHAVSRRSPTPVMPWSWRISFARTCTHTGLSHTTATWAGRSRSWPAPNKTPPGTGSNCPTSSARSFASTTPPLWTPSPPGRTASAAQKPGSCSPSPTPTKAARLSLNQLRSALKRAGRQRGIDADAERIRAVFRGEYAHQPPLVEDALGMQLLALLRQLDAACLAADQLEEAVNEAFPQHPDAEVIQSFPGLGTQLGARILAEIGDDHTRFADARGLKAYAGASPVTRASGKKSSITRRWVKNDRLNHAGYLWAFSAISASPGANAHYRRRRETGDWHAAAQRNLFNRLLGQLYHCLQKHELFDEGIAFPAPLLAAA